MLCCLVTQPNNFILEFNLTPNAYGQECLDKYINKDGNFYWLNLRNLIKQQINHSDTIRLYLKVKFYVPPYLIQQTSTRLRSQEVKVVEDNKLAKLIALIAQAEIGNFQEDSFDLKKLYLEWISFLKRNHSDASLLRLKSRINRKRRKHDFEEDILPGSNNSLSEDSITKYLIHNFTEDFKKVYLSVITYHQSFVGYLSAQAKNIFLEEVSELDDIGVDYFSAIVEGSLDKSCKIGVGTRGVSIKQRTTKLINYTSLVKVRTSTHFFTLKYINDDHQIVDIKFCLSSTKLANALYRDVTEKHVFYSCDTVGNSVTNQCVVGIAGMFWSITPSIFKDSSMSGKCFVFDIRKTLRQFYDDVQRSIFKVKTHFKNELIFDAISSSIDCIDNQSQSSHPLETVPECQKISSSDRLLCRICYDCPVSCAFMPCGHVVGCQECCNVCDVCPLCRARVEGRLKIFFH